MTNTPAPAAGFRVDALPPAVLTVVRDTGLDAAGNPVVHVVAAHAAPLRCCLRNAEVGEKLLLFGYEPPIPAGPYREVGAVFAHAEACSGPADDGYPPAWRGREQVLRAYDGRGWIHPATRTHDGMDPEGVLAEMFADRGVAQIHSRNVAYGCFMFTVTR
jgi:hypothetical protein